MPARGGCQALWGEAAGNPGEGGCLRAHFSLLLKYTPPPIAPVHPFPRAVGEAGVCP